MRLRGIELQGFKSFPDRTKLTFDDGITAIVGPNGSGKSNISDAVRWVFGEQSSKTLRGAKMEDVIFGGTQQRKAQGIAWVSLIIDNSDHTLAVESDEVTILRKLYRSGESEYRINNQLVRLRDVMELFLDTGLGRDGYSVIGQGRIAEIVGAKSNQRREIFEEAAGIAKFRLRKTDAERRLGAAEENLIRLRDILGELEGRVEPLRVQAAKAQEFLTLAQEKRILEISLWVETLSALSARIREQEDKILVCKSDRDTTQSQIDRIEDDISQLFRQMQQSAVEIEDRRMVIRELEESISRAEAEVAVMSNDISHNTQNRERIQGEIQGTATAGGQLEEQIAQTQAGKLQKQQALAVKEEALAQGQAQGEESRRRLDTMVVQLEGLKSQRAQLRTSVAQAQLESASAASLIEDAASRIAGMRDASQHRDENLIRLREEGQSATAFVAELEEKLASLANSRTGYAMKLDSRRQRQEALLREQKQYDTQAGQLLQRAQLLSDMEKNMEGFGQSVKHVMRKAASGELSGVFGPVSSLISVSEEYATAIEIALGGAMQNLVVESENVAKRAINLLVQAKAGRATFLPLTAVKGNRLTDQNVENRPGFLGVGAGLVTCDQRFRGVVEWLLGRVIIAENLDLAVELAKAGGNRYKIVTLDGQVVNPGGSMTGGYVAKSAGILGRRSEIERLQAEAEAATAKSRAVEERLVAEGRELGAVEAALTGIDAESRTAGEDLIQAQAEVRRLEISIREAEESHRQARQDYDSLESRLEELREKNLSSGELIEGFSAQLTQKEQEISALGTQREALTQQAQQQTEALSALRMEQMALGKDLELLESSLLLLTQQRDGQTQRLEELEGQAAALAADNARISQAMIARQARRAEEEEKIKELYAAIEESTAARTQLEQQSNQLRQEERTLGDQKEKVSGELARLEERHITMLSENDAIIGRLWDEYELSRSQAQEIAVAVEDQTAAQRRLTELRGRIKSLGSVNVAAIEEYKEVSQRYEFMRSQVEDIETSRRELGKIIEELTTDMRRIFLEKFQLINDQFGRIFVDLFGGGRARLELADQEDVLESGIDIFVQPPGKLIKNLTALSGGEQAFVAIAIYFAILKVSPAPFCLIDEIEAALDDVNVTKFASYLRRMTDHTQFIAISHRRGTMEEADVLYGVTMQEEGISKVLKLDVSEIESKLGLK